MKLSETHSFTATTSQNKFAKPDLGCLHAPRLCIVEDAQSWILLICPSKHESGVAVVLKRWTRPRRRPVSNVGPAMGEPLHICVEDGAEFVTNRVKKKHSEHLFRSVTACSYPCSASSILRWSLLQFGWREGSRFQQIEWRDWSQGCSNRNHTLLHVLTLKSIEYNFENSIDFVKSVLPIFRNFS